MRPITCLTLPLLFLFLVTGCADQATAPELDVTASFARGGGGKPDESKPGDDPGGPLKFISIETSNWVLAGGFTCALEDDDDGVGPVYCWGYNGTYSLGLGGKKRGGTTGPTEPVGGEDFLFSDVKVGRLFACGIEDSNKDGKGKIYCWGQNAHGELGDGTTTNRSVPTQVASDEDFFALDLGLSGGCALAVEAGEAGGVGDMYCWGVGGYNPSTPTPVAGGHQFQALVTFTQKATCGIDAADLAWCWGINSAGEVDINFSVWESPPQSVLGDHHFQALATYYGDMTCGLTTEGDPDYSSGEILCWGADSSGEYPVPTPIDPGDGKNDRPFTALVSGLCALGISGQAYCWGRNTFGSVGNGEASGTWGGSVYPPEAVASPGTFQMMGGKDLHTCGIATDGFAYCWGANESGELGDGTTRDSPLPVKVARQ